MRRTLSAWSAILTLVTAGVMAASSTVLAQATGTISGRITASMDGRPLAGAAVAVTGTGLGANTNAQGQYTITGVPAGTRTVRATFAGFNEGTQQVAVAAGQTATANLALTAQAVMLEEVVAIGYGTARRRDLTGSIASVNADEAIVQAAPTSAVASALQGRAPGVQVVSNSGAPGSGVSVRVRGSNSIAANSEPLYVIDGLPVTQGSSGTGNPLAGIDPSDIESMEILKDASNTAIYGARGANGVILITTKRGARGVNQVQFETSYGIQQITSDIEVLNGPQFMQFQNEANVNGNRPPNFTQAQIDAAQTFDYLSAVTQDAPQMNHALTISGGDEQTRYLVGANYSEQQGVIIGWEFDRYGFRLNLDREVSGRFRVGNSLSLTHVVQSDPGGGSAYHAAMLYYPFVSFRDEQGNWRLNLGEFGVQGIPSNPVATVNEVIENDRLWRGIGNIFAEYDLTDALRLRSTFGGNFSFGRDATFSPRTISQGFSNLGSASIDTDQGVDLTNENLLTYRRELGPGSLDLLAGFSIQTSDSESQSLDGQTLPSDVLRWYDLGVTTSNRNVDSGESAWTLLSQLGRINYNLLDKYLFTVTARRDGSSRFGAENKWAFFPSAAVAWRVIDENFMLNQTLFSDLKLRLSYGRTGNQAISEYQSLPRMGTDFYVLGTSPSEVIGISPSASAGNPDLKWETQEQLNAGLDLGFIDNRITLNFDAYQSTTRDLLLTVDLPFSTGFSTQLQNVGSVRNRGIEAAINTLNWEGDFFTWRSTLNISRNRNEVLALVGGQESFLPGGSTVTGISGETNIVQVGEPLGAIYGMATDGLFQAGDECPFFARPALCAPGEIKAVDLNGDGNLSLADRQILGYGDPEFHGGFNNSMTFGPVSLDAFFNFSYGNDLANLARGWSMLARALGNERVEVLNRWTPSNTNTDIPRANWQRDGFLYETLVEDASYLRLQTLTLGYRLPDNLLPGVASSRLVVTGQNVWLLTDYSGFDPESNARGGSSTLRGIDWQTFPRARTWNVGASVTF